MCYVSAYLCHAMISSCGLWNNMPEAEILERLPHSQEESEQVR